MLNKKALSLAIAMSLTATGVLAAGSNDDAKIAKYQQAALVITCLLYTSPSPRDTR